MIFVTTSKSSFSKHLFNVVTYLYGDLGLYGDKLWVLIL